MKKRLKVESSTITYDSLADTLTARFDDRNTAHSINIHDVLIIDLTDSNKITGLEFLDVSELFDLDKSDLSKIYNIILKIIYDEDSRELLVKTYIEFKDEDKVSSKEIIIQPIKSNPIFS